MSNHATGRDRPSVTGSTTARNGAVNEKPEFVAAPVKFSGRSAGQTLAGSAAMAAMASLFGCGAGQAPAESTGVTVQASVSTPQTTLDANNLPKFVEALPTFNGRRINGAATVNVRMQEFQQKVLPASFYAGLAAP